MLSLAICRLLVEYNFDVSVIKGIGVGGRLICEDVEKYLVKVSVKEFVLVVVVLVV